MAWLYRESLLVDNFIDLACTASTYLDLAKEKQMIFARQHFDRIKDPTEAATDEAYREYLFGRCVTCGEIMDVCDCSYWEGEE